MDYKQDKRVVATLDAGGTNFVFGAICGGEDIVPALTLPSLADDLDKCLGQFVEGFSRIIEQLGPQRRPVAISFAFPGPADYPAGIIGGFLPNFPSFRNGVALGPFLSRHFGIPVYINNDADLFAYGEAIAGALPAINDRLRKAGSAKQYRNLIGYTFGTGFGFGLVSEGKLYIGDNSCTETFCLPHKKFPHVIVEDGVSIRAVKRVYGNLSGDMAHGLEPVEIACVAEGTAAGDRHAAVGAFQEMGQIAGDAIATAVTLLDGLVVIGGGLAGASKHIYPAMLREMRSRMVTLSGETLDRVQMKVYNLDDEADFEKFARGGQRAITIHGTDIPITYDPQKRIGVVTSTLGANRAISLGAYAFALNKIDGGL